MGFKSHIKKILCYPLKLKYLNQKVFYPTLKKHNFFLGNIEYIYQWVSNPTFEKKKKGVLAGSRPGRPGHGLTRFDQVIALTGILTNPDQSNPRVGRVPGRPARPIRV